MQLKPDQETAVEFLGNAGRGIYADPPGAGKTAATLTWIERYGMRSKTLVVAPSTEVAEHWTREAERWTPNQPCHLGLGDPAKRQAAREKWHRQGGILVVLYETIRGQDYEHLRAIQPEVFVADEAHRLKTRQAQQGKAAVAISRSAKRMALLTGTPVLNTPEELWSMLHLIDRRTYSSFWRWAREHFEVVKTNFHGKLPRDIELVGDLKPGHEAQLQMQLSGVLLQRPDTLDQPPAEHHIIRVELSPEEREAYDRMSEHGWTIVDGYITYAGNQLARMTRKRQLATEWKALGEGAVTGSKVQAAYELICGKLAHDAVVVGTQFKPAARALAERTPWVSILYTGDQTKTERKAALEQFRQGEVQAIIGTQATMGEGVDGMQRAHHMVSIDRDWTPFRNDQWVARCRRHGQQKVVHVWNIVAADTVDEDVIDVLTHKRHEIGRVL